jgi:hypothetical protein
MTASARIAITNTLVEGDYTGVIGVGPEGKLVNVILDTGSSALAVSAKAYTPTFAKGETETDLAQIQAYDDGSSWEGAVIRTDVYFGDKEKIKGTHVAVAAAYHATPSAFDKADGILGLAYKPLDQVRRMHEPTWTAKYPVEEIHKGAKAHIVPCLTQLANEGVLQEKVAFYTKRSFVRAGHGGAQDPLNHGFVIIGGGEDAKDLYSGEFQTAAVLADDWYSTNLKAIVVRDRVFPVSPKAAKGSTTNSIVDSGTNTLSLGRNLCDAIASTLTAEQQEAFEHGLNGRGVATAGLGLELWPVLRFVLQGLTNDEDVTLTVPPENYWQVDSPRAGESQLAVSKGQEGGAILGLPLMNDYFTIFDGTVGKGVIKFAKRK